MPPLSAWTSRAALTLLTHCAFLGCRWTALLSPAPLGLPLVTPHPSPGNAANTRSNACMRCTSLSCPWTAQLSLLWRNSPQFAATPPPSSTAHASPDPCKHCVFLGFHWTALRSPSRIGAPQVTPDPSPSAAANGHSNASPSVDAPPIPRLPLDGAADLAMVCIAPVPSKSVAKQDIPHTP